LLRGTPRPRRRGAPRAGPGQSRPTLDCCLPYAASRSPAEISDPEPAYRWASRRPCRGRAESGVRKNNTAHLYGFSVRSGGDGRVMTAPPAAAQTLAALRLARRPVTLGHARVVGVVEEDLLPACARTRARCHSPPEFAVPIGILRMNENGEE
jgi:hypothetical protein